MSKFRNSIEYIVKSKYALFSDPITRVGGEKFSYPIPTYEAVKGITNAIYWKPTFIWIIDSVRVMHKIQTESKAVKPVKMNGAGNKRNDLSYYTYLRDVEYQVQAHFIWNENYPQFKNDRDENKHHNMAKRAVEKGGRLDIFLGTRECQGYIEPCEFGNGVGYYDAYGEFDFGIQFHGYDYPNETGNEKLVKRFWRAKMTDGIITYPRPLECDENLKSYVRPMKMRQFHNSSISHTL